MIVGEMEVSNVDRGCLPNFFVQGFQASKLLILVLARFSRRCIKRDGAQAVQRRFFAGGLWRVGVGNPHGLLAPVPGAFSGLVRGFLCQRAGRPQDACARRDEQAPTAMSNM